MNVTRYSPWSSGNHLRSEMQHVFDRFLTEDGDQSSVVTSEWTPRVDIREEDKRFVILADIPGVPAQNIEVNMDKGILSIKGERQSELREQGENGKLTRIERSYGSFHRRFALPDSADADGIRANGKDGVLEISIPKKPETTPRRITINS